MTGVIIAFIAIILGLLVAPIGLYFAIAVMVFGGALGIAVLWIEP